METPIIPRNSHAMTLDQSSGILYILGGLKSKTDLNDLIAYDLSSCQVSTLHDGKGPLAPPCGLTQRAFFHQQKRQIRVLVGSAVQSSRTYKKSRNATIDGPLQFPLNLASNSFFLGLAMWIYSIDKKQWRIMKHNSGPIARRAHAVTNLSGMAPFTLYFCFKLQAQLVLLFCIQVGLIIAGKYRQLQCCSFPCFYLPSNQGYYIK